MVKVNIICVGKPKEKFIVPGIKEYIKRLNPYARVKIMDVGVEKGPSEPNDAESAQMMEREGERLLQRIKPTSYTFALDMRGEQLTSEGLAKKIDRLTVTGKSEFNFFIGGPLGLHKSVLRKSDYILSLSKMTFPHQLVPLILLEQVYRVFKIMKGEPYHR